MSVSHDLVRAARAFLGVRFAHQGRNPDSGLDCLGLLIASATAAGITLNGCLPTEFDDRQYGHRPDTERLQRSLDAQLDAVALPNVGDVLLLRVAGRPQHLALVSDYPADGELGMIHAYAAARKVVEHRLDETWRAQIARVYRLPA